MEYDFWFNIFLECDVKDVLLFRLVCKKFKTIIDDEHFWFKMMNRDFKDLHKLNEETWFSYYKRRSINYGIPVIIDKKEYFVNTENVNKTSYKDSYKCSYSVLKNDIVKCHYNQLNFRTYVLSTENKLYSFGRNGKPSQLKNFNDIKNFEKSTRGSFSIFFIDNKNDLYKIDKFLTTKLLSSNVINIFRSHTNDGILYYTTECGTYSISNDEDDTITKIFDEPVLSWLKMGKFDFYITRTYQLKERYFNDDKYHNFELKAKQLSYINPDNFAILGTDGFIRIFNYEDKIYKIDIPNIDSISENTFLTKNGDLYYFDENFKTILIDTDVVSIGNFSQIEEFGCYIKRYI